ncbi:MAG: phosphate ABC transporter permease PstA [Acidimicrobiales bacterium]|nr:phosphate ABC transporter permease PstA [Acidimicrobiales bacterium]
MWTLATLSLVCIVAPLAWLVWGVVGRALPHWNWSILTTKPGGATGGGLSTLIVGTLVITGGVAIVAGIIGIGSGLYLAELCPEGKGKILRTASEVLSGVPAIVLGFLGYTVLVVELKWGFSLGAALVVLSIMVVPYIAKATEVAILQVPTAFREAAEGLGMTRWQTLRRAVLKPAAPGIVTGLIIALAIAMGETAPLLYTAGASNNFPTTHLTHSPVGFLTYAVWTDYNQPLAGSAELSAMAAVLLLVIVLILILLSRLVIRVSKKYSINNSHGGS